MRQSVITAAKAVGLADGLITGEHMSVFAPTDEAFTAFADGADEYLLKPTIKPDWRVLVDQSNVVKTDILAENGINHAIGKVVLPTRWSIGNGGQFERCLLLTKPFIHFLQLEMNSPQPPEAVINKRGLECR